MKAYIEQLIDYNYWANGLILKYSEKLDTKVFIEETADRQTSIRENLLHIMFAERLWLDRTEKKNKTLGEYNKLFSPKKFPTTKEIYGDWFDLELRMRAFVNTLTDARIIESFRYTRFTEETEYEGRYVDMLTQVVLHGMQHRAEVAQALTAHSHSPGNIDYLTYLRP